MILCACFYIDKTEWFEEQFLYSRHLYNQGRYVINNITEICARLNCHR